MAIKSSGLPKNGHYDQTVREKDPELVVRILHLAHFDNDPPEEKHLADPLSYPGTPRWVKLCVTVALFAVALLAFVHLVGGGLAHLVGHSGGPAPLPGVDARGMARP